MDDDCNEYFINISIIGIINNRMYDVLQQNRNRQLLIDLETSRFRNIVYKQILIGKTMNVEDRM